jgi:hypothetical protein
MRNVYKILVGKPGRKGHLRDIGVNYTIVLKWILKIQDVDSFHYGTVLEDVCDKPIRIQSYCAVARLHGV